MLAQGFVASALFIAGAVTLNGCGATQSISPPQTALSHARSWMLPGTSSAELLYTTEGGDVSVLSYPQGKVVGTLSGFDEVGGLCSDANGNVFVTTRYTEVIYEYAHGGTEPMAKLKDFGYYPAGCAVDPVTGNLAVTNPTSMNGGEGNVAIYTHGTGKPAFYSAYGVYGYDWAAYDTSGNLYVKGSSLAEMPFGTTSISKISVDVFGEAIHWDGQYLAMMDDYDKQIYRLAISGSSATVVSTVRITGLFMRMEDDFVVVPNGIVLSYGNQAAKSWRLGQFAYPKGGMVKKKICKQEPVLAMTLSI